MASSIGRRYAQAYFDLAREQRTIPQRRDDLVRAVETLSTPEVADALANPRLGPVLACRSESNAL